MNLLPVNALALSMAAQKGIYAALLGSGISRDAGIPTGWQVVVDLIRKLAVARGADCGPDPEAWYRTEFGGEPGYSTLLAQVAPTEAARMVLLRGYFEADDEERERGEKRPTAAHHAVARLVRDGHLRVILTTNFDRLLERAIEAEGVSPTVIASPAQVRGALPFHQTACTIVKLHGDYLDPRIKNTAEELADYDPAVRALLDRVLDEHGLVVCGWSATWDHALREALEARVSRRFPSYWVDVRPLSGRSADLARHLGASFIEATADGFLGGLADAVEAVEASGRGHPADTVVAVARLKRLVVDPGGRIRLHDLVMEETARVHARLLDLAVFPKDPSHDAESFLRTADRYVGRCATLLALLAEGARWGTRAHHDLWAEALEMALEDPQDRGGLVWALDMRALPGTLLLYAAGIGAVRSSDPERFVLLARLWNACEQRRGRERRPAADVVNPMDTLDGDILRRTKEYRAATFAVGRYLHDRLRPVLSTVFRSEAAYTDAFDRWEVLLSLMLFARSRGYCGRIGDDGFLDESRAFTETVRELASRGGGWGPVVAGLFDEPTASRGLAKLKEWASEARRGGGAW